MFQNAKQKYREILKSNKCFNTCIVGELLQHTSYKKIEHCKG